MATHGLVTILMVENHLPEAFAVRESLARSGRDFQIWPVCDAAEACLFLEELAPDAILFDTELVGHSPWEALRRVRAAAGSVPMVALATSPGQESRAREIGVSDVLMKSEILTSGLPRVLLHQIELARLRAEVSTLQAQCQQVQKMEVLNQLSTGLVHDFNNMLFAIIGFNGLLVENLPADQAEGIYAREIQAAAERAAGLSQKFLEVSKISAAKPAPSALDDLLVANLSLITKMLGPQITVETEFDAGGGKILADAVQISQLLLNLVANAGEAMPQGGRLRIATSRESDRTLLLEVIDTGCGMSAEVKQRMFEPFFTTKPRGRGTGLGLGICLGIVKNHGGTLAIESSPGQGTTCRITFPLVVEPGLDLVPRIPRVPVPARINRAHRALVVHEESTIDGTFAKNEIHALPPRKKPSRRSRRRKKLNAAA